MLRFSKICRHPYFQNSEVSVASIGPIPAISRVRHHLYCWSNEIKTVRCLGVLQRHDIAYRHSYSRLAGSKIYHIWYDIYIICYDMTWYDIMSWHDMTRLWRMTLDLWRMTYVMWPDIWYDIWYMIRYMIWYDIWCDMWCDVMWYMIYDTWYIMYDMIHDMIWYIWYDIYDMIWYNIWYDTIR